MTLILPEESGERLSVAVTLMLAVTVFMLLMAEMMPESSDYVPLLMIFFIFCLIMMTLIVVYLCCVSRLYNICSLLKCPMGEWTRYYFYQKLSFFLGIRIAFKQ